MFPIQCVEVKNPETKIGAWARVVYTLFWIVLLQALFAGLFAAGINSLFQTGQSKDMINAFLQIAIGLPSSICLPIMFWVLLKDQINDAWHFET